MEAAAASTIVRGAKAGFGGFKRPEDDRVANAGNRCSAAFKIRCVRCECAGGAVESGRG